MVINNMGERCLLSDVLNEVLKSAGGADQKTAPASDAETRGSEKEPVIDCNSPPETIATAVVDGMKLEIVVTPGKHGSYDITFRPGDGSAASYSTTLQTLESLYNSIAEAMKQESCASQIGNLGARVDSSDVANFYGVILRKADELIADNLCVSRKIPEGLEKTAIAAYLASSVSSDNSENSFSRNFLKLFLTDYASKAFQYYFGNSLWINVLDGGMPYIAISLSENLRHGETVEIIRGFAGLASRVYAWKFQEQKKQS